MFDCFRLLSRFDETPTDVLIELTDEGFRSLGEPGDVAIEQERLNIIDALPNEKKKRSISKHCAMRPI